MPRSEEDRQLYLPVSKGEEEALLPSRVMCHELPLPQLYTVLSAAAYDRMIVVPDHADMPTLSYIT